MQPTAFVFDDAIAQTYDDYLGPFAFEPFAADLAGRATTAPAANVLELACGTGRVTRHLAAHLTPRPNSRPPTSTPVCWPWRSAKSWPPTWPGTWWT